MYSGYIKIVMSLDIITFGNKYCKIKKITESAQQDRETGNANNIPPTPTSNDDTPDMKFWSKTWFVCKQYMMILHVIGR